MKPAASWIGGKRIDNCFQQPSEPTAPVNNELFLYSPLGLTGPLWRVNQLELELVMPTYPRCRHPRIGCPMRCVLKKPNFGMLFRQRLDFNTQSIINIKISLTLTCKHVFYQFSKLIRNFCIQYRHIYTDTYRHIYRFSTRFNFTKKKLTLW